MTERRQKCSPGRMEAMVARRRKIGYVMTIILGSFFVWCVRGIRYGLAGGTRRGRRFWGDGEGGHGLSAHARGDAFGRHVKHDMAVQRG